MLSKVVIFYVIGFICLEFAAEVLAKVQEQNEVRTSVFSLRRICFISRFN